MVVTELEERYEAKREAAPALLVALVALVGLALVSWSQGWALLGLSWWVWLVLAVPEFVLLLDLVFGAGLAGTRTLALVALGCLVVFNAIGLAILVAGLMTTNTAKLGGGELLLTAVVIFITNVIVFGIWYWEIDDGGPVARTRHRRAAPDFQFPQDENPGLGRADWSPHMWDYLYISVTNAIAFSPTDAMPLTRHAKLVMGLESTISIVTVLLVGARAVNVLGS